MDSASLETSSGSTPKTVLNPESTTVGLDEATGGCIGIWVDGIGAGGCVGEAFLPGQDGSTISGNGFTEASRLTSLATIVLGGRQ